MVVDGVELLRMIKNREIKDRTKIYVEPSCSADHRFYTITGIYRQLHLWREDIYGKEEDVDIRILDTEDLVKNSFVLSEEDKEIDIQALQETQKTCVINDLESAEFVIRKNEDNIKDLIKAVKQLDKKIK